MLARKKREGGEERNQPDEIMSSKTNKKDFVNASLFDTKPRRSLETSNLLRDLEPKGVEVEGPRIKKRDLGETIVTREKRFVFICMFH